MAEILPLRKTSWSKSPITRYTVHASAGEAVLLEALGAIRGLGVSVGGTHHDACQHGPCIATRAIEKYWEVVLAPYGEAPPEKTS